MQAPTHQAPTSSDRQGTEGSGGTVSFEGFDPPESNFWRLPNNWFDLVARFTSWAEHKVVEYILRHTWGYHEYGVVKLITMDEFMHGRKRRDGSRLDAGCGMAENSIKKGIADAVAHGFLVVQVDDSDRGRIKKYYAPRMRRPLQDEGEHGVQPGGQLLTGQGQSLTPQDRPLILEEQALTPGVSPLTLTGQPLILSPLPADPRTEQTLLVTHPEQDTKRQQSTVAVEPGLGRSKTVPSSSNTQHQDNQASTSHRPRIVPASHRQANKRASNPRRESTLPLPGHGNEPISPRRDARPGRHEYVTPADLRAEVPGGAQGRVDSPDPLRSDLVARLVAEGIATAKARSLVQALPAERIERQLLWIDSRAYRNRAATLVASIEGDFSAPPPRRGSAEAAGFDRAKYYRGPYALCPRCGSRPCLPDCGKPHAAGARG